MSGILTALPGIIADTPGGSPPAPGDTQTVTVGYTFFKGMTSWGYEQLSYLGSISDGTFNLKSGAPITQLSWSSVSSFLSFRITGLYTNDGWDRMVIGTLSFSRSAASFSQSGGSTFWQWNVANPFSVVGGNVNAEFFA